MKGGAGALHDRPIEPVAQVEVLEILQSAVVLGSTQSLDVVNTAQATELGFDVVRRRSGGGVVILQTGDHAWIDVTVPRGHRMWSDDVERATWWLGDAWCSELRAVDSSATWLVHRDKLVASAPERAVCFASVGPGEVVRRDVGGAIRKVVGVSQRRNKDAARFQCTIFRQINLALYERLLREPPPISLRGAIGVGDLLDDVVRRVVGRLERELAY